MTSTQTDRPPDLNWSAERVVQIESRKLGASLTLAERRLLLAVVDLLLINLALLVAAVLWLDFPVSPAVLLDHFKWFVTLSALWLLLGFALDIYDPVRAASTTFSLFNSAIAALVTGGVYSMIPWFTPPLIRRIYLVGFVALMVLAVVAWRVIYARCFCQPSFQRRALIVGQDATALRVADELQAAATAERANPFRGTGYHVVGFVDQLPVGETPMLDPTHSLVRSIRTSGVDEVLVADGADFSLEFQEALLDCREIGIPITPLSVAYERLIARLPVAYAERDLDLIASTRDSATLRLYHITKRLLDLTLALLGMLAMGLLMPFVAFGNVFTSPGPLFYRQQRVGRGGSPFKLIKFRTMVPDAEQACGAVWAAERDPRVTPMGRWLRRTRLDELPQVINVLQGKMSMVGPRPERPQFVGEISRVLPIYRARHSVLPGLTGWAQIRYPYGQSIEDSRIKLEYDLYYIKHAGLLQDFLILLQTVLVILRFKGR